MKAVRIKNWAETFETAETRRKVKSMQWIRMPSGCDSNGFLTLAGMGTEGAQALGVFMALCQGYAGKFRIMDRDGCFRKSGGKPMSIGDIAALIRMEKALVESALHLLASEDVGWVEFVDESLSGSHPDVVATDSGLEERRGEEKRGERTPLPPEGDGCGKRSKRNGPEVSELFEEFWAIMPTKKGRGAAERAFRRAAKEHDPKLIVKRTALYLSAEQERYRAKPEGYQPLHPATWLNQRRFLDEPEAIPVPPKRLLDTAWKASGRNGSGPPEWALLSNDEFTLESMCVAYRPLATLVDGIKEAAQMLTR